MRPDGTIRMIGDTLSGLMAYTSGRHALEPSNLRPGQNHAAVAVILAPAGSIHTLN
jgi:hypothetical protein